MLTHEVQYQIGRMPMQQGFSMDALITKDAHEIALLFAPSSQTAKKSPFRPSLTPPERARTRLWRIINDMKCVTHEKIPGRHTHVIMRIRAPGELACQGCHFSSEKTFGCVLRDRGLMKYYIQKKIPIETTSEDAPIPIQLPVQNQRPIVWELPLRVSQLR